MGAEPEVEVETLRGGRKREALPRKQKCGGEEQVPAGPTANVLKAPACGRKGSWRPGDAA